MESKQIIMCLIDITLLSYVRLIRGQCVADTVLFLSDVLSLRFASTLTTCVTVSNSVLNKKTSCCVILSVLQSVSAKVWLISVIKHSAFLNTRIFGTLTAATLTSLSICFFTIRSSSIFAL